MTTPPIDNRQSEPANPDFTGLPLLHTWPAVYTFILLSFAIIVALLTWLTGVFS